MMLRLALLLLAALVFGAGAARAASDDTLYNIMVPEKGVRAAKQPKSNYEPWLAPKYETPRSERQPVIVVPETPHPRAQATVPPPLISPRTGRALPNLPGASSTEGFQDRAARCAYQAGAYSNDINSPAGYIGACINQ